VGYRITRGGVSVFYVPDLVYAHEQHQALYVCASKIIKLKGI